ncbi:MAG: hypothetical protein Ct9H90mP26_0110 [Methanobacteriota archaeon]|nr:MAG: hypothetical protein Ct9H90mP26_0110 [Euryarchaeota archaeon]
MGYRPDLNEVLPAPNFLPGLVLKEQMRRDPMTDELLPEWSVDLDRTLSNLRGEGEDGNPLAEDDPDCGNTSSLEVGSRKSGRVPSRSPRGEMPTLRKPRYRG